MENTLQKNQNQCSSCQLAHQCIAAKIDKQVLKKHPDLKFKAHVLKPGEHLYRQGEKQESLYALRTGTIKSYTTLDEGDEFVMGFFLAPALLGWEAIDEKQLSVSLIALDYVNLCEIPLKKFETLEKEIPQLREQLLQMVSQRIQQDNIAILRSSAKQRVADFMLQLLNGYFNIGQTEPCYKLLMSQQDIANYLRITPETMSRTIKTFQEIQVIEFKNKNIHVLDLEKLKEIARPKSH